MVYFGEESNLGRGHGVVIWQEQLKLEDTTYTQSEDRTYGFFGLISPSYGDWVGPCIETSKYRRLSS